MTPKPDTQPSSQSRASAATGGGDFVGWQTVVAIVECIGRPDLENDRQALAHIRTLHVAHD